MLTLFANGRVEQFLHCATLTPQQMCDPRFIPRVAALLARFHSVRVPLPRRPSTFPTIRRWLRMARRLRFDPADPKAAAYASLDFAAMAAEVDAVEAACAAAASPVVFSHNDLLSGNILILQRPGFDPKAPDLDGPLTVIDFEYGAYTHRGFDFGNHFNEYAGFECDYSRWVVCFLFLGGGVTGRFGRRWGGSEGRLQGRGRGEAARAARGRCH